MLSTVSRSFLTVFHQWADCGAQDLRGNADGRADPSWPKEYPILHDTVLRTETAGRRQKGRWNFRVMPPVFQSHHFLWGPAFLDVAEHQPANGKQRINSLFSFAFALPTQLPLSQLKKLPHFYLSSSHPGLTAKLGGTELAQHSVLGSSTLDML